MNTAIERLGQQIEALLARINEFLIQGENLDVLAGTTLG